MAVAITSADNNALGSNRHIVRTSGGDIYVLVTTTDVSGKHLEMWKSENGGTAWSEKDSGNQPDGDQVQRGAIAIDSNNLIHVAYFVYDIDASPDGYRLKYVTFNTGTDTWGTPEVAYDFGNNETAVCFVGIALDSSGYPHLVCSRDETDKEDVTYFIEYANKVGGSWGTVEVLSSSNINQRPDIALDKNDIPILVWWTNYMGGGTCFAWGNQTDASSFTMTIAADGYSSLDLSSICIDSNDVVWVGYRNSSGYIAISKNGATYYDWTAYTDSDTGMYVSIVAAGADIYVFYRNTGESACYYNKYDGTAWLGQITLQFSSGIIISSPKWQYLWDNGSDIQIDYVWRNYLSQDVYWDKLILPRARITADGILKGTETADILADGLLEGEAYAEIFADAILVVSGETYYANITADAILKATSTVPVTADAILKATSVMDILGDAILKGVEILPITADGILQISNTVAFLADGLLEGEFYSEILADAVLKGTAVVEISADAYLVYTYTVGIASDGILLSIGTSAITADAILFAETLLYQLCIPSMSCEVLLSCDIETVTPATPNESLLPINPAWILPVSHYDPDGKWDTEAYAYDGNTGTGASNYQEGSFLELILPYEIMCEKIRVFVDDMDTINIDVYTQGAWIDVYSGAVVELEWVEKTIPGGPKVITKIRIACTYSMLGALYEVEVWGEYYAGELSMEITNEPLLTCDIERYVCGS